jgi:hypothetical protein
VEHEFLLVVSTELMKLGAVRFGGYRYLGRARCADHVLRGVSAAGNRAGRYLALRFVNLANKTNLRPILHLNRRITSIWFRAHLVLKRHGVVRKKFCDSLTCGTAVRRPINKRRGPRLSHDQHKCAQLLLLLHFEQCPGTPQIYAYDTCFLLPELH